MSLSTSVMKEKTSHHTSQMHLWSLFLYVFVPVCILNTDTDACSSKPGENCKNLRDSRFLRVFMPGFFCLFGWFFLMIQFQLLHCPLIRLCVAFCQANLCLFYSLREMSCTKQHVSECMNHFRCWRLNKHIRFLGGCSTQTPPLSVCVMFKDRHVNCRGRIRLHIPDKSKLFFSGFH